MSLHFDAWSPSPLQRPRSLSLWARWRKRRRRVRLERALWERRLRERQAQATASAGYHVRLTGGSTVKALVSAYTSPARDGEARTSTGCSTGGLRRVETDTQATPRGANRTIAPSSSGIATAGNRGEGAPLTTANGDSARPLGTALRRARERGA